MIRIFSMIIVSALMISSCCSDNISDGSYVFGVEAIKNAARSIDSDQKITVVGYAAKRRNSVVLYDHRKFSQMSSLNMSGMMMGIPVRDSDIHAFNDNCHGELVVVHGRLKIIDLEYVVVPIFNIVSPGQEKFIDCLQKSW